MHLRIHYVMLSACIQFRVQLVFKEVMTFPQWAATKWKGYTSMSEWTPADGDDNDIVSSSSKLELVVFKLTNVSTTMDATCIGVCSCVFIFINESTCKLHEY